MADEFVSVLVPKSRVLEVYAFLGSAKSESQPEPPERNVGELPKTYDQPLVERAYLESSPKMMLLFDTLADRPGERISSTDLATAIGYDRSQLAGVLGAFGRRWKNRHKNQGRWPFRAEWDGQWIYWMEPDEAAIINTVRDAK